MSKPIFKNEPDEDENSSFLNDLVKVASRKAVEDSQKPLAPEFPDAKEFAKNSAPKSHHVQVNDDVEVDVQYTADGGPVEGLLFHAEVVINDGDRETKFKISDSVRTFDQIIVDRVREQIAATSKKMEKQNRGKGKEQAGK